MANVDDLIGLPVVGAPGNRPASAVDELSALPQVEGTRTILPSMRRSGEGGAAISSALAVLEQPAAGIWALGSMAAGAGMATVNTFREKLRQWTEGGLPEDKPGTGGAPVHRGKDLLSIWVDEYNSAAENAASKYVPITPEGAAVTHKMGEWMTVGGQWLGDKFFEQGIPVPHPAEMIPRALGIETPLQRATKGAPVSGAIGQAVATLATMLPVGVKPAPRMPAPKPVLSPFQVWETLAQKYPETTKRLDTIGSVRMSDFHPNDTTIFDPVQRRLNAELGLTGEAANVPFETKVQAAIIKTDPTLPIGDVQKATRSFVDQLNQLDEIRKARADATGLPQPGAITNEPVVVTPGGVALTPEQAAAADSAFIGMTSGQRADVMGVSAMGRLRLQLEETQRLEAEGKVREARAARNKLKQDWAKNFPYRDPEKRASALDAFENFGGRMTWEEASGKMGEPLPTAPKGRGITKAGPGAHQLGVINIEGLSYTLRALQSLPDKEVLKAATVLGAINQANVPGPERALLGDLIKGRDSITREELKREVAANILPLRARDTLEYATYGLDAIGNNLRLRWTDRADPLKSAPARTTIWEMPLEGNSQHFDNPNYFAHTRSFDDKGVRSIVEIQSDVMQRLGGEVENPLKLLPEDTPTARNLLQTVLETDASMIDLTPSERAALDHVSRRSGIPPESLMDDLFIFAHMLEDSITAAIAASHDTKTLLRPMQDRWVERLVLEENRRASEQGVRTLRVADANTVTKVEGWPASGWFANVGDFKYYVSNNVNPTTGRPLVSRIIGMRGNSIETDIRIKGAAEQDRIAEAVRKQISEGTATPYFTHDEVQGIYNRYQRDIPKMLQKNFGARHVVDEKGNGWWEWPVRAEDWKEKILAFGGRLGGPRAKQRGALIIEGFEDVQKKLAEASGKAAQAGARAWPLGDIESERQAHAKVQAAFNKSLAAQEESVKVTFGDRLARVKRGVFGHDIDLKDALDKVGPYGEAAKNRMVLQRGATDSARIEMEAINERIFKDLSPDEKRLVDEIARARRVIEIDAYKGIGKVAHEGGINGMEAEAFVRQTRRNLGEEQFARLNAKVDAIFRTYKDLLVDRLQDGLISANDFDKLIHFDYTPTQYIDLLDPILTYDIHGRKVSVRSSGVQDLGHGKRAPTMMDSQQLLAEAIGRTRNLQFKNRTLQALYELGVEKPDNGIVQVVKDGKPNQPKPHGWSRLGVRIGGEQKEIFMLDELAEQFVANPQPMLPWVANAIRLLSGSAILRTTAVGANPVFPVAGLPMDILHTWMASGREYSPHLPVYAAQIGRDMLAVLPDIVSKSGDYQQAMREGLGAHYATDYGQHVFTRDRTMAERMMPRYDKIMRVLRGFNQEADIWIRLAHRRRLISEGVSSADATAIARDRLDYAQGGELIKGLDTAIPWTNVGVQALYKVGKSAQKNPADFAVKSAWLGGAIVSSVLANMISSPETWQSIPAGDKIRGLNITFGDQFYIIDPDGNKRYLYVPVRMDQTAAPLAALSVGLLEAGEYGRVPSNLLKETMQQSVNLLGGVDLIPSLSAGMTMMGLDPYTGRMLRDSPAPGPYTSPFATMLGDATSTSPIRLEAAFGKIISPNNLWLRMAGSGVKQLLDDSNPREKEKITEHVLAEHLRPIVKLTNPLTKFLDGVDEVVKDVTDVQQRQQYELDTLLYKVGRGTASRDDIKTYINNQPPEDRPRLVARAQHGYAIDQVLRRYEAGSAPGVPPAAWWRVLAGAPARARAQEFHSKWLDASPEDRRKMEAIAGGISQAGGGFMSEDFKRELAKERALLGTEQR